MKIEFETVQEVEDKLRTVIDNMFGFEGFNLWYDSEQIVVEQYCHDSGNLSIICTMQKSEKRDFWDFSSKHTKGKACLTTKTMFETVLKALFNHRLNQFCECCNISCSF